MADGDSTIALAVLLAGGLRPSPVARELGRSVLDVPITPRGTVLEAWTERLAALGPRISSSFRVRVIFGGQGFTPERRAVADAPVPVSIEAQRGEFRGPAGIARDAAAVEDPDAMLLIAEGARYCGVPLADAVDRHMERGADVTVLTNPDSSPAGIYLIRARALSIVPEVGFMDLKEQWLTRATADGFSVWCDALREPGAVQLRTREDCLLAARVASGISVGRRGNHPFQGSAELNEGVCAVVSPSAVVGAGVVLQDAVVCADARIGPGAAIVRSVIGPGSSVEAGAEVVDRTVHAEERVAVDAGPAEGGRALPRRGGRPSK